jgi:hypothetical protein
MCIYNLHAPDIVIGSMEMKLEQELHMMVGHEC